MDCFKLSIITPEKSKDFDDVLELVAKSPVGVFGVRALHEPFIFNLVSGDVKLLFKDNSSLTINVFDGTLIVDGKNYKMTALSCDGI